MNDLQKGDLVYINKTHYSLVIETNGNTIKIKSIWSLEYNYLTWTSERYSWALYSTIFRGNI